MKKNNIKKIFIGIIIILFLVFYYVYNNYYNENKIITNELENFLTNKQPLPQKLFRKFQEAKTVCFLPPYSRIINPGIPLSEEEKARLDKKIGAMWFGYSDTNSWIIGITNGNLVYAYSINVRLNTKTYICGLTQSMVLSPLTEKIGRDEYLSLGVKF